MVLQFLPIAAKIAGLALAERKNKKEAEPPPQKRPLGDLEDKLRALLKVKDR
jgi:hypothetical protein